MRTPESFRQELEQLDAVVAAWESHGDLDAYPAAKVSLESLLDRRRQLIADLADAEVAAVTVLMDAPDALVGRGDIAVDLLVDFLGPFQEAVSSVGQALHGPTTSRAPLPALVREETALRLTGTFAGSFGLALEGPRFSEQTLLAMLPDAEEADFPVFDRAVTLVLDVIEQTSPSLEHQYSTEEVLATLAGVGSRAQRHLRNLASAIASTDASAELRFSPPAGETRTVVLSRPGAERLERVLTDTSVTEREVKMRGRLVGASLVRDRFELELPDGTVLGGRVSESVLSTLREYFSEECTATLQVTTAQSAVDETEVENYVLTGIR